MLEVGLHSIFLSSKSKGPEILAQAAHGNFRVIFLCVEMVEGPSTQGTRPAKFKFYPAKTFS